MRGCARGQWDTSLTGYELKLRDYRLDALGVVHHTRGEKWH
jgi:hypothetical protein